MPQLCFGLFHTPKLVSTRGSSSPPHSRYPIPQSPRTHQRLPFCAVGRHPSPLLPYQHDVHAQEPSPQPPA